VVKRALGATAKSQSKPSGCLVFAVTARETETWNHRQRSPYHQECAMQFL
jgi:hypothetical protein